MRPLTLTVGCSFSAEDNFANVTNATMDEQMDMTYFWVPVEQEGQGALVIEINLLLSIVLQQKFTVSTGGTSGQGTSGQSTSGSETDTSGDTTNSTSDGTARRKRSTVGDALFSQYLFEVRSAVGEALFSQYVFEVRSAVGEALFSQYLFEVRSAVGEALISQYLFEVRCADEDAFFPQYLR